MIKITYFKPRKKLLLITTGAVIVTGGIYALLSVSQWTQVKDSAVAAERLLQSQKKILFSPSTSVKERHEAINKLADMPQFKGCTVGWWADWQATVISSAKTTQKKCEAMRAKQASVQETAKNTEVLLQDQKTIQSILTKLTLGKTAISEGNFAQYSKTATSVSVTLEKQAVQDISRSLLKKAQTVAKAIAGAWKGIENAHKAENRSRYEQSINHLDQAYLRLGEVSDEAISVYTTLLSDLKSDLS